MNGVHVLQGHLFVLRKLSLKWDRAYFVLVSSSLFMYRDVEAYKNDVCEEECHLAGASLHLVRGEVKPLLSETRRHCFRVNAQGKQLLLSGDRPEVTTVWSEALRRSCSNARKERFGGDINLTPDSQQRIQGQAVQLRLNKQTSRKLDSVSVSTLCSQRILSVPSARDAAHDPRSGSGSNSSTGWSSGTRSRTATIDSLASPPDGQKGQNLCAMGGFI